MIYVESTLSHHLFSVSIRKLIAAISTDAQKNERRLKVSPLKRGVVLLQEYNSWRVMDEPKLGL